jgi:MFS family permease
MVPTPPRAHGDEKKTSHRRSPSIEDPESLAAWPIPDDDELERAVSRHERGESVEAEVTHEHKPSGLSLSRTLSRRSATSSRWEPGPAPDGGTVAWTQAAMAHLTIFSTWGWITSYGVFQEYYRTSLDLTPSTISWIGSVQIFLLFFLGTFSGRALDAGLFRPVYITGSVLQLLGVFSMSEAKNFWQLFLSQGLCLGIANGLHFCPAMSLVSTYFVRKRALVVGVAAMGSCTGGIVFPIIIQQLLPRIGFPWTIRVCGFIMLLTNICTITFYRTRLPPRKTGPLVEWSSFKEWPFMLYCIASFFNFWGLYFAFFFVGSYGREILGMSYPDSINLLLTMVGVGFLWRILPNYFADKVGSLNMLLPFTVLAGTMLLAWIGVHTRASLFVFAAIYGSGSAGMQSLFPAGLSSLTEDLKKAGVRMGMGFTIVSFACLTGPPLVCSSQKTSHASYTDLTIVLVGWSVDSTREWKLLVCADVRQCSQTIIVTNLLTRIPQMGRL